MTADPRFPVPDIFTAKRILCVQPHYDDADLSIGGTLARLSDGGAEIFYLTVTNDLMGVIDTSLSAEAATQQLRSEQAATAQILGIKEHHWLDFPDAGSYDYFEVRRGIIRTIRLLQPDFLFAIDPWLPYEAHHDHILAGQASAEAAILYGLMRIPTDPAVDAAYTPHALKGVAFYTTRTPNTVVDISTTRERKHKAARCFLAQFTAEELEMLVGWLEKRENAYGEANGLPCAEGLMVLPTRMLHCGV